MLEPTESAVDSTELITHLVDQALKVMTKKEMNGGRRFIAGAQQLLDALIYDQDVKKYPIDSSPARLIGELSRIALTEAYKAVQVARSEAAKANDPLKEGVNLSLGLVILQKIIDAGGSEQLINAFASVKSANLN